MTLTGRTRRLIAVNLFYATMETPTSGYACPPRVRRCASHHLAVSGRSPDHDPYLSSRAILKAIHDMPFPRVRQPFALNGPTRITRSGSSAYSTRSFVILSDSKYVFLADERTHQYTLDISNPSLIPTLPPPPKHHDIFLLLVRRQ
jgi:hypothetical protein